MRSFEAVSAPSREGNRPQEAAVEVPLRSLFDNTAVCTKHRLPRVREGPTGGLQSKLEAALKSKIKH